MAADKNQVITELALCGEEEERLSCLCKAMAHPMRVRLMQWLNQQADDSGWVCNQLVRRLPLAQSTVSEHLRILRESGLLVREFHGQNSRYCINDEALEYLRSSLGRL